LADATTVIDGDRITTGTIDATQVNVTNIRADSISVGTGTINTGAIPTLNQSKVSGLTTDLSNVNTAASNAQSTANTAIGDASTAQSTANTAISDASTAQSTANTAQSTATTAQSTANTAESTANTAQSTANTANNTANTAYTTAIGKIKSYYQSSTPTASAVGDIWFNTSQQKNYYWTGSSWQAVALTADSIAANYVYAGNISATQINAGTIDAARFVGAGIAHVGATAVNISAELGTTNLSASISGLQAGTRLIGIAGISGYKTNGGQRAFSTTASLSGAGSSGSVTTFNGVQEQNDVYIGGWLGAVVSGATTSTGTATLSVTISRLPASGASGNTAFKGSVVILGVQG
jgi:hypothetical protein